jgi:branched-chain amino acid aminotransferase
MTGTPFCILPVSSINKSPIGNGPMGKITRKLLDAWSSEAGVDIVKQIKKWDAEQTGKKAKGPSPYSFGGGE